MFEMEWHGRRVALKASSGRYVCMKKNGQLAAISDFVGEHSLPSVGWGSLSCRASASEALLNLTHQGRQIDPRCLLLYCLWANGTSEEHLGSGVLGSLPQ